MLQQARSSEACFSEIMQSSRPEAYRKVQPLELVQNWLEQEDSDLVKCMSYGFLVMASLFMMFSFIRYLIK